MLHTLVDGQEREVTSARQTAMIIDALHIAQHSRFAVTPGHHPLNKIIAGQMKLILGYGLTVVR